MHVKHARDNIITTSSPLLNLDDDDDDDDETTRWYTTNILLHATGYFLRVSNSMFSPEEIVQCSAST